jgi:putative ABC transport system permease protein
MIVKGLPLILKHLRHNWIRTASTVLAMTLCIFLFCTLEHVVSAIEWGLKNANATRLFTRHSVSLTFPMPPAYKERIASVSGVRAVAISNWFGGVYQDAKNFFTNFAVEAEPYFSMYPEYSVPPDQMSEFLKDLKGCILGRETAKKFGWDIGSVFQLESFIPSYRKQEPFEFTVRGIYDTDLEKHPGIPQNMMFFHFKYLYEGTGQKAQVGTFISQVADPDKASEVSRAIDLLFESSDAPTRTETEAAFIASFI